MSEIISTDKRFNESQRQTLAALADMMIPAVDDMPSAADPDILHEALGDMSRHRESISRGLAALANMAEATGKTPFAKLQDTDRLALVERLKVEQPDFVGILQTHVLASYYRDDRVLHALGLPARAPFPEGNAMPPTDWSLLDPVRARQPFYRTV